MAKPVIGTNTGGTVELIEDGVNGYLYSPGDVAALAEKISSLVESPDTAREFGDRARSSIVRKLREKPVSELMYALGRRFKGEPGPRPTQLLTNLLEWQSGWSDDLEERLQLLTEEFVSSQDQSRIKDARLAEFESELVSAQAVKSDLQAQLSSRDGQIEHLGTRSRALEQELESLRSELIQRDEQVEQLDSRAKASEEKMESLRSEIEERDENIGSLRTQIDGIVSSRAWRIANKFWRARLLLVPPGSRRERFLRRLGF
jgi:DNA repair exonuclease SbcCD ATPase subunit